MIKKIIYTLVIVCMTLCAGFADAATLTVGYCDGHLAEKGASKTGMGTISAAIRLPKEMLTEYTGARVTHIRVGLMTTEGVSNPRAWLRGDLEGEDLAVAAIPNAVEGWNEVAVEVPYTLDGEKDLYLGFSFEQQKSVKCISLVGAPQANGYFIAKDDSWQEKGESANGVLSVEMIVEGDNLPACDLSILSSALQSKVVRSGDKAVITSVVKNMAAAPIESYTLTYILAGGESVSDTYTDGLLYRRSDTIVREISTEGMVVENGIEVEVQASIVDDVDDDRPENNCAKLSFATYDRTYEHRVLLEQFTTEHCPNCPRGIASIDEAMLTYNDQVIHVAHHAGYKYDWLSIEDSKVYEWFYGEDGTYAPAKMLDRRCIKGDVPVSGIGYSDDVFSAIEQVLPAPALVDVVPVANYDGENNKISIEVTCGKIAAFDFQCPAPCLTLFVVEDSILAVDQAGISSTTFKHANVVRDVVSDVWGDAVVWNGDEAKMNYTVDVPADWDASRLMIVAFLSEYSAQDRNACVVYNTGRCRVNGVESVALTASDKAIASVEYYSLQGFRLAKKPTDGFCIVRTLYADGTSKTQKVVIR